jgi:hypothetical protein
MRCMLRIRVPRQLGKGVGSASPEDGYAWFAGI